MCALNAQLELSSTYREEDANRSTLTVKITTKTTEIVSLAIKVSHLLLDNVFKIRIYSKETLFAQNSTRIIDVRNALLDTSLGRIDSVRKSVIYADLTLKAMEDALLVSLDTNSLQTENVDYCQFLNK